MITHDRDITDFLRYIETERRLSANTVAAYRNDLSQWADYATDGGTHPLCADTTSVNDLRLWISTLARNKVTQRSIRRKVQSLRAFFHFMMLRRGLKSNPASELQLARLPKALPVYVTTAEMNAIIDSPLSPDDITEVRDRLIVAMLYATGIRCSELTGLTDANVDTSTGELKVLGKRNKERIVPFGRELSDMIENYRRLKTEAGIAGISPTLFTRPDGEALSRNAVYGIVHRSLSEGGAHATRLSPHVLRHSFASDMLNGGAPLNAVQRLLGHQSLQTTEIYTHLTYSELLNNYQSAHPRAQKTREEHGN